MTLGISNLYTKNKDIFLDFISQTNEKDIIVEEIMKIGTIQSLAMGKKEIIITDIWAGNWIIAEKIISQIKDLNYIYYFIEPSKDLIEKFKTKNFKNIVYINDVIENTELPKSDIVIASYVFQSVSNEEQVLSKIYNSLNAWAKAIIINQNIDSNDMILRKKIGLGISETSKYIFQKLNNLWLDYFHEIKTSHFYWVDDVLNLTETWKNYISFLTFSNFSNLNENQLEVIIDFVRENSENWTLEKKEDFIYLTK